MASIEHLNQNQIMTKSELNLKLDRARWHVMQHSPFYGQLLMSLPDVIGNPHGKTACTDGLCIKWDTDFLAKLTDEETRFVMLHEVMHCAHCHLWRFPVGKTDHAIANQACDHAINLSLNSDKLQIKMPAGGLADKQFSGLAEEEIYALIASQPKQPKQQPGKPGAGNGDPGDSCGDYCEPADEADMGKDGKPSDKTGAGGNGKPTLRETWERNIIQASIKANASQGDIPSDMERLLEKLAVNQIDWKQETSNFVRNSASSRNDWTRSPRRHAWQSVIYPSRKSNEIGWIVGVRDTSGSIDDKLAAEFSAILAQACAELNCGLILLDCDCRVQAEYRIAPGDDVPLTAKGGGGTAAKPAFDRCAQLIEDGEKIAGIVYLTDLYLSDWPGEEIIPTLCICTNDSIAPSGRTIQIL